MRHLKKHDKRLAWLFAALTVAFLLAASASPSFSHWVWARHHNPLSWYIRPLLLIPYCLAAYARSWSGISASVFAMATSMCWFPAPAVPDPQVEAFLAVEMAWLRAPWTAGKVLLASSVPLSLGLLALAFWQRNLRLGVALLPLIAIAKVAWSIREAGTVGMSIIVPAGFGLVACLGVLWWALARARRDR